MALVLAPAFRISTAAATRSADITVGLPPSRPWVRVFEASAGVLSDGVDA